VQSPWTLTYANGNNAVIQAGIYSTVVLVRARNACGWTSGSLSGNPHIHYLNVCGAYGIYSYPNPVDDQLTISLAEDVQVNVEGIGANGLTTDKNPRSNLIENIVIYDDSGNEIISQICSDVSVNIDCSSLKEGTYIIHINTNNEKIIRRFIK
jgi:hypothetical protein